MARLSKPLEMLVKNFDPYILKDWDEVQFVFDLHCEHSGNNQPTNHLTQVIHNESNRYSQALRKHNRKHK